jgi:hypothetical protein
MCVCVCMFVCVYACVCMCVCTRVYLCARVGVYMTRCQQIMGTHVIEKSASESFAKRKTMRQF